ncbi:RagB/SusD family nutrient uptake outer membrane protein [Daejeonella sp.]|uniref:RagB/SusD family nutrient uptake outer membrane protein n=1 Tax=Daejeonella sp. TaxID=2805397 RepID=UPI0030C3F282
MKKNISYLFILTALITGCKKDFLTQLPLDQLTNETFWTSENNVRTFASAFYAPNFAGYGSSYTGGDYFSRQTLNDDFGPSAPDPFPINVPTSGGGWDFSSIRKANIFIEKVKTVPMPAEAINHWTGVGRFFRGLEYAKLVNRFGDVPYYFKPLTETSPELYKTRDPRTLVMDSVLADFKFAAEKIRVVDASTGPKGLIVNRDVALAFMSRLFLFEGTWQKYHGANVAKATEYLTAAKWAANELITQGRYNLGSDYRALFSSPELSGNPEMIMYRVYETAKLTHTIMTYNNKASQTGPTKNVIETYLCSDGLPISVSPLYKGDKTILNVVSNRDKRLTATFASEIRLPGIFANSGTTGYVAHKFLNDALKDATEGSLDLNTTDAPVIRYGEVLLNYAEASAELGQLTQADLNISMNKLRARTGILMPPLQIIGGLPGVNGAAYDDPKRDPTVSPMLWEIRRERRVELIYEGFRLNDLRRWAKLAYTDTKSNADINRGAWIKASDYPKSSAVVEGGVEGYIIPSPNSQRIFVDPKVYLSPLPLDQIQLYKDQGVELKQNAGW